MTTSLQPLLPSISPIQDFTKLSSKYPFIIKIYSLNIIAEIFLVNVVPVIIYLTLSSFQTDSNSLDLISHGLYANYSMCICVLWM